MRAGFAQHAAAQVDRHAVKVTLIEEERPLRRIVGVQVAEISPVGDLPQQPALRRQGVVVFHHRAPEWIDRRIGAPQTAVEDAQETAWIRDPECAHKNPACGRRLQLVLLKDALDDAPLVRLERGPAEQFFDFAEADGIRGGNEIVEERVGEIDD